MLFYFIFVCLVGMFSVIYFDSYLVFCLRIDSGKHFVSSVLNCLLIVGLFTSKSSLCRARSQGTDADVRALCSATPDSNALNLRLAIYADWNTNVLGR